MLSSRPNFLLRFTTTTYGLSTRNPQPSHASQPQQTEQHPSYHHHATVHLHHHHYSNSSVSSSSTQHLTTDHAYSPPLSSSQAWAISSCFCPGPSPSLKMCFCAHCGRSFVAGTESDCSSSFSLDRAVRGVSGIAILSEHALSCLCIVGVNGTQIAKVSGVWLGGMNRLLRVGILEVEILIGRVSMSDGVLELFWEECVIWTLSFESRTWWDCGPYDLWEPVCLGEEGMLSRKVSGLELCALEAFLSGNGKCCNCVRDGAVEISTLKCYDCVSLWVDQVLALGAFANEILFCLSSWSSCYSWNNLTHSQIEHALVLGVEVEQAWEDS